MDPWAYTCGCQIRYMINAYTHEAKSFRCELHSLIFVLTQELAFEGQ